MTDSNFTSVSRRPAQHYLTANVQMPNCPKINNWAAVWKQYLCDESVYKKNDQLSFKIIPPDTSTCDTVIKSSEVTLNRIKKNDVELKNKEKYMPIDAEELFDRIKNSSENTSKKLENLEYENMNDNIHLSDKSCDLNKKRNKTKIHIDENIEKVTQDEVLSDSREMITQDEVLSDSCEMVNYSNKETLKQEKKITKTVCSVESSVSNTTYILTHLKHSTEKINNKVKDNKAVNDDLKKLKFSKPTEKVCNGAQLKGNNKIQLNEVFPKGSNNINKFRSFIPVFNKRGILPKTYPSLNKQKSTVEPNLASNKVQILLVENVDMKDSNQIIRNQHSKQVGDKTKNSVPIKADINDRIIDEKRLNSSVYESETYSGLPLVLNDRNECTKFISQLSKNSAVKSNEEHCISDLTYIVKSSEKIREVVQNTGEIRKNVQKSITENSITTKIEVCNFSSAPSELTNNQNERTNDSVFNISGNTFIIECDGNLKENRELIGSKILTSQKPVKTFTSSLKKYRDSQSQSDESEFIKISKNQYMLTDDDDIEDHIFFSKEKNKENQISNRSILDEKKKFNEKLSLKKNLDAREIDLNCVGVSNKTNMHNIANSRSSKENRTFGHSQREKISLNLYTNQKNESYEKPLESSKIKTENINNNTLTSNVEKKRGQQFCLDESDSIFDIKDDRRQNQKSNARHISKSRVSEKRFEFETNISGKTYVKKHSQHDSDYLDIINLSDSSDSSICVTEKIPSRLENSVKKKSDLENNTSGGTYILENRTRIDKPDLNFMKKLRSSSSLEPSNYSTDNSDFISTERNLKSKHIAEKKLCAIESNGSQSTYLIEPGNLSKEKKKAHGSDIINSSILSHKSATMSNVLNNQSMYQIDVPVMVHSSFLGEIDQKATCSNHQRVQKTDKEKVDRNTKTVFEEPSKSNRLFDTRKSPRLNIKSNGSNLVQGVDRNNETVSEAPSSTNGFNSTNKKVAAKSFKSDTSFFKRLHFSTIDSDEDEDLENFVIDMCNKRKTQSISRKTRGTINKNADVFKIPHRASLKSIYKKRSSVYTGKKSIHSNGFQMTKGKNEPVKNYFVAKTNRQDECSTSRINSDIGNSMRRNIVNCFSTNVDKNNKSDLKRVTGRLTSFVSKRNGKRNPMDADKSSSSIGDHSVCSGSKQFSDGTFSPRADSATTFLSEQINENVRTGKSLNLEKRSDAVNCITDEKHPINFSSKSNDSFSGHTYILDKNGSQNYELNTVSAINESNDRTREEGFKKLSREEKGLHKNSPKDCQLKRLKVSLTRIDDLSINEHALETERNKIYKIESNTKRYTDPPWLVSREHDDRSKNIAVKNNNNCESEYQKSIEVSDKNSSMLDESLEMSNCTLDNSDIIIRSSEKDKTKSKSRKTTDLTRECSEIDFNDFPSTKNLIDKHPNNQPSIEKRIEITNRSRTDEKKPTPSEHDENTSSEERIVDGRVKNRSNIIRHLNFDRGCTSTPNAFMKYTRHDNADRRSESSNRESSLDKICDLSQNSIKETDKNSQEYQNGHLCISNVSHNLKSTDATIISSHVLPLQERITPIAADLKFQSDIHTDSGSDSEIIFRSSNIVTPKMPMSDSHTRMRINNNSNRSSKSHKSSVKARKSKLVQSETKNICLQSDLNIGSETRTVKNPENFIDRDASKDTELRENISESPNKYVTSTNSLSPITNNEFDRFASNMVMLNKHNNSESEQFSIDEMSEVPRLKSRVNKTSSSSIHNSPGTNNVYEPEATTSTFPLILIDRNECTNRIDRFSNKSAAKSNEEHFIRTCDSPANSAQCDRAAGRKCSLSNTISKRIERSKDDYHFKEPYIAANENSHNFMELNPSKCIEQTQLKPYNSNRSNLFLDKVSFSSGYGTSNDVISVRSVNTSKKSTDKRSQNREPAYGLVKDAETNRSTSNLSFSKFFSTHGDASNVIDSSWTDDGSLEINVSTELLSNVHIENAHRDTAVISSESSRTESPKVIKRARKNTKEPYVPTHNYNTRCKVKATKSLENSNINKHETLPSVKKTESSKPTNTKTRTRSLKTKIKETNTNKNKVQPEEPTIRLKRKLYSRHLESSPCSSPVVTDEQIEEKKGEPVVVPEDGKDNEISSTSCALDIEYLRDLKMMIDAELEAFNKKSSNNCVPHSPMDPRTKNDPTNLRNTPLSTIITKKIIQSKQSGSCKLNKISQRARKLNMTFY